MAKKGKNIEKELTHDEKVDIVVKMMGDIPSMETTKKEINKN